jgi:Sec-independent protein translocase protein TatA
MNGWIEFWKWMYIIGLGSFVIVVLVVIPFGARDLMALFKHLGREVDTIHDQTPDDEDSQG